MIGRARPPVRSSETVVAELLEQQRRRFATLDPGLPEAAAPPPGEIVVTPSPAGDAAGVAGEHSWPAGSGPLLWSAVHVGELHPVVGDTGATGLDALLGAWRSRFGPRLHEADSAAVVTWPSADVAATRVFLDRGLAPLAVLAVRPNTPLRPGPGAEVDPDLRIRRAGPSDLEACVALALEELHYSSQVGGSIVRPDAAQMKRTTLRDRLARGEPTWIARRASSGAVVGMLECGQADAAPGTWLGTLLPPGRWGYVNCASVLSRERGHGVGRALVAAALPVLQHPDGAACRGTYLYYNPPNPVSSVFWPRQGYRPLWTLWETRPAFRLRPS